MTAAHRQDVLKSSQAKSFLSQTVETANVSALLKLSLNSEEIELMVLEASVKGWETEGFVASVAGGRGTRGPDEKWEQTGKEVAQRHLAHDDAQNFQAGAEGSGWRRGKS